LDVTAVRTEEFSRTRDEKEDEDDFSNTSLIKPQGADCSPIPET
jgi:hypothetical protein